MRSHDLGRRSEQVACDYLTRHGWVILARNYRAGPREIDIVARRADTLAFVEVKARVAGEYGHPFEAIGWQKRRELARAARDWLRRHPDTVSEYRFDAVAITWRGQSHILEHLENAWNVRE